MHRLRRFYRVLAIETSCDDSAACLIERLARPKLIEHRKRTLNSAQHGGIIPIDAMSHHLANVGPVVKELLAAHNYPRIDLVCATRGPGMYSSLAAGFQLAKGLALAWQVPFIGVHHMLGHLLTPRFFDNGPKFPFFSLLISGGHTMLVYSKALNDHKIISETIDIAAGNALDKCARILGMEGVMLGKELDMFCQNGETAPVEFEVALPLEKAHNKDVKRAAFSFAHFSSLLPRIAQELGHSPLQSQPDQLRRAYGNKFQAAIFEHIVRKSQLAMNQMVADGELVEGQQVDFVLSGGVAANSILREKVTHMQTALNLNLHITPLEWCTDNALMIGWAGIEMYEAGMGLNCNGATPTAKWPLENLSEG